MMRFLMYSVLWALPLCAQAQVPTGQVYAGWHKQYNDTLRGANMTAAIDYLKARHLKARKSVIVGVLDSGVDTTEVSLRSVLWTNPKERHDGRDNDRNGYVDDVHGWNFLGTADGSFNMTSAGTQEYREFKRLYPKYKQADDRAESGNAEYDYYKLMRKKAGINGYILSYEYAQVRAAARQRMDSIVQTMPAVGRDTLSIRGLLLLPVADASWETSAQVMLTDLMRADRKMLWTDFLRKQDAALQLMARRINGIEHDADKRLLMGDNLADAGDRYYGNNTLQVEGCEHGTFVAGIIAGTAPRDSRYSGLWPAARVMVVRCSPEGDEYDKDVATSIRYAADNGAKVINVSLGKYTSPDAAMVNEAIAYAARKDVLIVQAAGNNHLDIDSVAYFPSAVDARGQRMANYVRVGASDTRGRCSQISNYGLRQVDLFAPGELIASVFPGSRYELSQGTSVAAPVVSAVAAMLRSYFPKLKAAQVKQILMRSARPMTDGRWSMSGGVIDALAAVKLAQTY